MASLLIIGLILLYMDFSVNHIDILPDFVGYILILFFFVRLYKMLHIHGFSEKLNDKGNIVSLKKLKVSRITLCALATVSELISVFQLISANNVVSLLLWIINLMATFILSLWIYHDIGLLYPQNNPLIPYKKPIWITLIFVMFLEIISPFFSLFWNGFSYIFTLLRMAVSVPLIVFWGKVFNRIQKNN